MLARLSLRLIDYYRAHRAELAPLAPLGSCRYHPTCSGYGRTAYARFGFLYGTLLTGWRIWRCSPWGGEGHDPVPHRRDGRPDAPGASESIPDDPRRCRTCRATERAGRGVATAR